MALFTTARAGSSASQSITYGNSIPSVVHYEIDLADFYSNNSTFATGDQISLLGIPEDTMVLGLVLENATALTNITQLDLGDATDDDRFVAAASTLTAGTNHTIIIAVLPYHYTADANLALKVTGTVASMTGTIRVTAILAEVARKAPAVSPIADSTT